MLEAAALFLVLAAPPYWLGFSDLYVILLLLVAAAYVIGTQVSVLLRLPADAAAGPRFAVFALAQLVSGCAVVVGPSIVLATTWIGFAYREEMISPDGMGLGWPYSIATVAPLALGLTAVATVVFLASAALLRRDGEGVGAWFARVRADRKAILWPAVAVWLVLGCAVLSLANVLALLVAYRRIQERSVDSLCGRRGGSQIGLPATAVILASIAGGYAWFVYTLHIGFVAALGTVAMIVSWGEVSRATDAWIDAQQVAGREPAEIAAELRSHGSWTADGPAPGRSRSDPRLGGTLAELGLSTDCSVTVDAGIADNSALRNEDWIAGYVAGFRPLPTVSYCIRLACPSPAAWQERPVVILHSSHPSRNAYWAYNLFMDVFGAGAAPNAGGYCTRHGELAARYQG
jgi:hypothetical protein